MSKSLIDRIPFAKIFTVLAIIAGVSLGLCAVTFGITSGGNSGGGFWIGLGLIAFWGSIAGLLVTLVVFVALSIFGGFSEKVSQPQKLFDAEDDTKSDKNE
jgi:thiol:disulfide interchange protein